jgi:hypothetical protein
MAVLACLIAVILTWRIGLCVPHLELWLKDRTLFAPQHFTIRAPARIFRIGA